MAATSSSSERTLEDDLEAALGVFAEVERHLGAGHAERVRASVSAWSVGQQLAHVCLAASSVATAIQRLLRKGRGEDESTQATRSLLATGSFPRGVATAPPGMTRPEPPTEEEIRTALAKARRRWKDLLPRRADIAAARGSLPHPLLGALDAEEWVRFAAVHGSHHLTIVDEILAD